MSINKDFLNLASDWLPSQIAPSANEATIKTKEKYVREIYYEL